MNINEGQSLMKSQGHIVRHGKTRLSVSDESVGLVVLDKQMAIGAVSICEPDIRTARANRKSLTNLCTRTRRPYRRRSGAVDSNNTGCSPNNDSASSGDRSRSNNSLKTNIVESQKSSSHHDHVSQEGSTAKKRRRHESILSIQSADDGDDVIRLGEQQYRELVSDLRHTLSEMLQNPEFNASMFGYLLNGITEAMESLLSSHCGKLSKQITSLVQALNTQQKAFVKSQTELSKHQGDLAEMTKTLQQVVNMLQTTVEQQQSAVQRQNQFTLEFQTSIEKAVEAAMTKVLATKRICRPVNHSNYRTQFRTNRKREFNRKLKQHEKDGWIVDDLPEPSCEANGHVPLALVLKPGQRYFSSVEVQAAACASDDKSVVMFDKLRGFIWRLLRLAVERQRITVKELEQMLWCGISPFHETERFLDGMAPAMKEIIDRSMEIFNLDKNQISQFFKEGLMTHLKHNFSNRMWRLRQDKRQGSNDTVKSDISVDSSPNEDRSLENGTGYSNNVSVGMKH